MIFKIKYLLIVATLVLLVHSTGTNGQAVFTAFSQSNQSETHPDQCSEDKQWFCFNSTTKAYNCIQIRSILPNQAMECLESGPALSFGYCATYNEDTKILSMLPQCGYFQYGVYNETTIPGYIQLPTVLTDLNDYMCGPLHRKGLVCRECADDYGPSLTSYWHRCANCTSVWYKVPLFLLIQFVPLTVFYIFVVLFQIRLTTPPMPCFIMVAHVFHIGFETVHPTGLLVSIISTKHGFYRLLDTSITQLLYSMFTLDFFLCALPPFCVSSKLKFNHIVLFGYISAFYPILLILLTWMCVELHGRNYRLFKWLWKPFQICFVRLKKQGINKKSDLVDVFATFFLLSYHKCVYQTQMYYITPLLIGTINVDPSGNYSSTKLRESGDKSSVSAYVSIHYVYQLCFAFYLLFC